MKDAQDIITSGFLQSAEERAHLSAFFSRYAAHLPPPALFVVPHHAPLGWMGLTHRSQPAAQASASDSQKASRPLGTRILPVYVFSLLLSPHLQNSLLDRSSLYTACVPPHHRTPLHTATADIARFFLCDAGRPRA
jgi:hypothetical protein